MYQMPKAKRDDGAKLFMGELTKTDNAGKNSPGPVYMFQDQVKYDAVSNIEETLLISFRPRDGQWEPKSV